MERSILKIITETLNTKNIKYIIYGSYVFNMYSEIHIDYNDIDITIQEYDIDNIIKNIYNILSDNMFNFVYYCDEMHHKFIINRLIKIDISFNDDILKKEINFDDFNLVDDMKFISKKDFVNNLNECIKRRYNEYIICKDYIEKDKIKEILYEIDHCLNFIKDEDFYDKIQVIKQDYKNISYNLYKIYDILISPFYKNVCLLLKHISNKYIITTKNNTDNAYVSLFKYVKLLSHYPDTKTLNYMYTKLERSIKQKNILEINDT